MLNTYDLQQAAEILKAHPHTIRALCKSGHIRACKVGRKWMITQESLAQYINKKENDCLQKVQAERSKKCQSTCEMEYGISTLPHRAASELDALLARPDAKLH